MNHEMSLISDTVLQFIGISITIIATIIAYSTLKKNAKKALSFKIVYPIPLLGYYKGIKDKLQITYNGKEVNNVRLSTFQFVNTGNVTINKEDFTQPLSIKFDNSVKIMNAEIIEAKPPTLKFAINFDSKKINIIPECDFLNSKDSFKIKVISENGFEKYELDYRIKDITEIKEIPDRTSSSYLLTVSLISIFVLLVGGLVGYLAIPNDLFLAMFGIGFLGAIITTGSATFIFLVRAYNFLRKRRIIFVKKE